MEDSHIVDLDLDGQGIAVFGVFDGHGGNFDYLLSFLGPEVADYCKENFLKALKENITSTNRNFPDALQ